jgi:hypothetical protein
MRYAFKCTNIQCKSRNVEVIINLPISEAGETQYCEECKEPLRKIFGTSIKPAGDKPKY